MSFQPDNLTRFFRYALPDNVSRLYKPFFTHLLRHAQSFGTNEFERFAVMFLVFFQARLEGLCSKQGLKLAGQTWFSEKFYPKI